MKHTEFIAHGSGEFPYDMLRYDACYPARDEDAANLECHQPQARSVVLVSSACDVPTVGRWASFGWRVEMV